MDCMDPDVRTVPKIADKLNQSISQILISLSNLNLSLPPSLPPSLSLSLPPRLSPPQL